VEVPDIRNLSDVNARSTLIELQLTPVTTEPQYDDDVPEGSVIEQQVDPGTELRQGERITYTLSLGARLVQVPDLVQVNINFARAEAERLGLEVEVQEQPSRTVTEGFIINQQPNPGARIQRGETVFFTVSIGDQVRLPNVVGKLRSEAERLIANSGLTLEYVDEQGPDRLPNYPIYRPNEVVSAAVIDNFGNPQPVDNGEYVPRNSKIVLGVRRP
jgi:serine/threonine-protein kinase